LGPYFGAVAFWGLILVRWHFGALFWCGGILGPCFGAVAFWGLILVRWHFGSLFWCSGILGPYFGAVAFWGLILVRWHFGALIKIVSKPCLYKLFHKETAISVVHMECTLYYQDVL